MNSLRPQTLAEVAARIADGEGPGYAIKDFLHEFHDSGHLSMLQAEPANLEGNVPEGKRLNAFLQALAVYLAVEIDCDPPTWTQASIKLADPWFASPGFAMRNYLLLSSPAPFRTRNLFIDEDSLKVA
jgi:hypothetical protein